MSQPEPPALGSLLRQHRHEAGLTLEELAEESGVSARAIGDMERGHSRGPQARTVQALAVALGLTRAATEELVGAARAGRRRRPAAAAPGLCDLPPAVPDFTGRETETAWLGRSITAPAGPPVSIVSGAPGLGKTALVVHAGARLVDRFADGCFFVDLRGLDAEPVVPHDALARLLRALGVRERDLPAETDERRVLYRRLMRDREALVVLDNAAHEAQVRDLLPGPGSSRLWVTSRRTLAGIEHARRLVLAPLPAGAATALLGAILAQREDETVGADGSAAPDDSGPDGSGPAVLARIAALCGNLPLALRIAGNRLLSRPAWSARGLAERLGDEDLRLQRLTAGDLRIRSAFRLSYEQLSEPVRRLFRRLALVPGPDFGPGAGAALTGLGPELVEEMLDELLDLGLLGHTATDRLLFHDLLRLYARERLQEEETSQERAAAEACAGGRERQLARRAARRGRGRPPCRGGADGGVHALVLRSLDQLGPLAHGLRAVPNGGPRAGRRHPGGHPRQLPGLGGALLLAPAPRVVGDRGAGGRTRPPGRGCHPGGLGALLRGGRRRPAGRAGRGGPPGPASGGAVRDGGRPRGAPAGAAGPGLRPGRHGQPRGRGGHHRRHPRTARRPGHRARRAHRRLHPASP
ncbi:helix-turn-helix domain-containing protein [Streptomyces sp. NRRL S-495]|uniref:helix-turn-helix domain-containing protein n=1 Tax=Streptomyces sp. NRRL S-495 TaxID=1609133 RepID=UPI00099D5F6A|nr:helix-turn-helix domain-containing protein [Streptomyces sp. NRRL S-495]